MRVAKNFKMGVLFKINRQNEYNFVCYNLGLEVIRGKQGNI